MKTEGYEADVARIFTSNAYFDGKNVEGSIDDLVNYIDSKQMYGTFANDDNDEVEGKIWEWSTPSYYEVYSWEDTHVKTIDSISDKFIKIWDKQFCVKDLHDRVALINERNSSMVSETMTRLEEHGAKGLLTSEAVHLMFKSTGNADRLSISILGEVLDVPFVDVKGSAKLVFDFALSCVAKYDKKILSVPIKVMEESVRNKSILGKAMNVGNPKVESSIVINESILKPSGVESVIATLIHELDHIITEADDNSREFRDASDNRLGSLVLDHYSDMEQLIKITQTKEDVK
jgi:hypothetical protein